MSVLFKTNPLVLLLISVVCPIVPPGHSLASEQPTLTQVMPSNDANQDQEGEKIEPIPPIQLPTRVILATPTKSPKAYLLLRYVTPEKECIQALIEFYNNFLDARVLYKKAGLNVWRAPIFLFVASSGEAILFPRNAEDESGWGIGVYRPNSHQFETLMTAAQLHAHSRLAFNEELR